MVLQGKSGDGFTLDEKEFAVTAADDSSTVSASDRVIAAILHATKIQPLPASSSGRARLDAPCRESCHGPKQYVVAIADQANSHRRQPVSARAIEE
jgi:hypothetical protein